MRIAILTVSDRAFNGIYPDRSGGELMQACLAQNWQVVQTAIVPDELDQITAQLIAWADGDAADLILTTGGTGFAPRDVTPEATLAVIDRAAPGLAEAMRAASLLVTPHAMLSRGVTGMRGKTLIVNLPGSPRAALENLAVMVPALPHAIALLRGDADANTTH